MIVFLAVIVGSIVIAMFLPLIAMITNLSGGGEGGGGGNNDRQPFRLTFVSKPAKKTLTNEALMRKYNVKTLHGRFIYS